MWDRTDTSMPVTVFQLLEALNLQLLSITRSALSEATFPPGSVILSRRSSRHTKKLLWSGNWTKQRTIQKKYCNATAHNGEVKYILNQQCESLAIQTGRAEGSISLH